MIRDLILYKNCTDFCTESENLTIFMCNFIFLSSKNFIKYWMKDLPPKIARFKLISIESILYSL